MRYNVKTNFSILFTLRESRYCPIFGVYPPIFVADCQGLAVNDYGFALGRLEAGTASTFAQLGFYIEWGTLFPKPFAGLVLKEIIKL